MQPAESPFPLGWLMHELPGYRDHVEKFRTYSVFGYEALPPLHELTGDFQWLADQPLYQDVREDEIKGYECYLSNLRQGAKACLVPLAKKALKLGLKLPPAYRVLMENPDLAARVQSVTGCYFDYNRRIVPNPVGEGYFITFMADSQGCCCWNLYLTADGACGIVSSLDAFDDYCDEDGEPYKRLQLPPDDDDEFAAWEFAGDAHPEPPHAEYAEAPERFLFCATGFEEFVYRCWIENRIWYLLKIHKEPLSGEYLRYAQHYQSAD